MPHKPRYYSGKSLCRVVRLVICSLTHIWDNALGVGFVFYPIKHHQLNVNTAQCCPTSILIDALKRLMVTSAAESTILNMQEDQLNHMYGKSNDGRAFTSHYLSICQSYTIKSCLRQQL